MIEDNEEFSKELNGKLAISLTSEMEMLFNAFPFCRYYKSQLDVKGRWKMNVLDSHHLWAKTLLVIKYCLYDARNITTTFI